MKRYRFLIALALGHWLLAFAVGPVLAQAPADSDKGEEKRVLEIGKWYPRLESGLNLTQSSYSDNWKGGDTGSLSWSAYMNGTAERQINPGLNWLNTMKLLYGQTREQEIDADGGRSWGDTDKSSDQADLEAIFRFTQGWGVDPYVSFRLETFFQDVTDPAGRDLYFNPMTFRESVGIACKFIDHENHQFLTRLGITARESYRRFFEAPTGGGTTSESAWDAGAEIVIDHTRVFNPSLTYQSRLSVYQPFTWSKTDVFEALSADSLASAGVDAEIADYTTAVDIDLEVTLTAKVVKLIAVQLFVEFNYDKYDNTVVPVVENGALTNADVVDTAVRKKGQFRETLGLGLVWTIE